MAERRMFTQKIVDSDAFLDMPLSTQCLYFHLNMRADDDGFVNNPKKVQRMIGASEDDLKLLIAKRFILGFENGVIVIKHWRMHNLLRKDRYNPTQYQEQLATLELKDNGSYTESVEIPMISEPDNQMATTWQPSDNQMATQDRIGKDSIGKVSIDYNGIKDAYNSICKSLPKVKTLSEARKKAIKARLNMYTVENLHEAFRKAEASDFLKGNNDSNWKADFDWILKDTNLPQVLEVKYDNKGKPKNEPQKETKTFDEIWGG